MFHKSISDTSDSAELESPLSDSLVKEKKNLSFKVQAYFANKIQKTSIVSHPEQDKDYRPPGTQFSIQPKLMNESR